MLEYIINIIVLLICSSLAFLAGRLGREVKVITIKQYDTIHEYDSKSKTVDLMFEDEEAFVPGDDLYETKRQNKTRN